MSAWWKKLFRRPSKRPEPTPKQEEVVSTPSEVKRIAQPSPKERGPVRRITIGLDFGTSTTKCCLHENEDGKDFHFLAYRGTPRGDTSVLMPTAASFHDGKLLFGWQAEHSADVEPVRSFKMCLLCQSQVEGGATHTSDCPNCLPEKRGWFRMGPEVVSAEDLSTLYVAHVLGLAKQVAPFLLRGRRENLKLFVNSAAPLDQMEEFGAVGSYFERVVHYGWLLAGRVSENIALEEGRALLTKVRTQPVPEVARSPTRVFPETHAAMTGYLLLPQSESGLYGLVDVGAGTTDVAYFWLQKDEQDTKAWYYAAGSKRVGMDDVDRALETAVSAGRGGVRAARESLDAAALEPYCELIDPVAKRIYSHQATILDQAMAIDQRESAWRHRGQARYRLFLAGGGNTTAAIRDRLCARSHVAPTWDEEPEYLRVTASNKIVCSDGQVESLGSIQQNAAHHLLLLSYGLAHRQVDIPKWDRDTEGVRRETAPDPIVEAPSGHWW